MGGMSVSNWSHRSFTPGSKLGASLAVKDRRVLEAQATITGVHAMDASAGWIGITVTGARDA